MAELDYKSEVNKLEEGLNKLEWFTPKPGKIKVKILKVCNEFKSTFKDIERTKTRFEVEVNGKELNWGVNHGQTETSLWGQLMKVGDKMQGLEGQEITLFVKGEGKNKSYTIEEALDESVEVEDEGEVKSE